MKILKVWGGIFLTVLIVTFGITRIAFEVLGASTAPDDFELLKQRMPRVLEWLFTTPWIVPTAIFVLLSAGAAWLLWSGLRGAALTPAPEAVSPTAAALKPPSPLGATIDLPPRTGWYERFDGAWLSKSLLFSTPAPVQNAKAYITKIQRARGGGWEILGVQYKCDLAWPGKSLEEQFAPRRVASSEDIIFLLYDTDTKKLYFYSSASYSDFREFAYVPNKGREEGLAILHGAYEITVLVEFDSGTVEERFLMFWSGDPSTLLLAKAGTL